MPPQRRHFGVSVVVGFWAALFVLAGQCSHAQPPPVHADGLAKMAHVRSRFPSFGGFDAQSMHFRSAHAASSHGSGHYLRSATTSRKSPRSGDSKMMLQQAYSANRIRPAVASNSGGAGDADIGAIDVDDFDPFGTGSPPPHPPHLMQLPGGGVNSVTGAPLLSPLHDMFKVRPPPADAATELLNARDDASSSHPKPGEQHAPPGSPFEGPAANFHAAPTAPAVVDYSGFHRAAGKEPTSVGMSAQAGAAGGLPPPPPPPPPPLMSVSSSKEHGGGLASSSAASGGMSWPTSAHGSTAAGHAAYPLSGLSGSGASKLFGGADLTAFMPSPTVGSAGSGNAAGAHTSLGGGGGPPLPVKPP